MRRLEDRRDQQKRSSPRGGLDLRRHRRIESVTARPFILLRSFLFPGWKAILRLLKTAASAAMKLIVKEGAMDMEKGEREPHPPADFDCLGAGIRGVVSQIADIDPRVVRDDIRMPHFKAPCMKSFLVTAEDAGGVHHLLLNRSHLEETLRRGDATVRTEFYSVGPSNDLSLMAARFSYPFSASGEARYSEHLRNLAVMRDELVRMGAMRYAHGGDRTSERFTKEQRENLATQLAQLTGKEVKTMMNWLTFIDKLSVEALDKLVALDCKRSVYEAIQPGKRLFIRGLRGATCTEEEKVEAVSEKVLELAEKHLRETPEREARPRTRHSTGNGMTHKADAPAAGNDTDPACVEDGEGNTPQKADRREQEGSEQQEQSDGESRLAESLEVLDRGLEAKVGKSSKKCTGRRETGWARSPARSCSSAWIRGDGGEDHAGRALFLTDAPIPSQWAPDQAEDGSW